MIINKDNYMDYLMTPFKLGGRDKDGLDCYGLVMKLYEKDGVKLPDVITPQSRVSINLTMQRKIDEQWEKCEDGPGALVHIDVPGVFSHVGMSFGNGQFVHIWDGSGSVEVQSIAEWSHRIKGYYRFVGNI